MSDIKTTGKRPGESGLVPKLNLGWHKPQGLYRCKVILVPEENGEYSVYAATLPGVASQGKTEEEALTNIVEAFEGVLATYREQGEKVPWTEVPREQERGAKIRWVIVHG